MKKSSIIVAFLVYIGHASGGEKNGAAEKSLNPQRTALAQIGVGTSIGLMAAIKLRHEWKIYTCIADEFKAKCPSHAVLQSWQENQQEWQSLQKMCGDSATQVHENKVLAKSELQRTTACRRMRHKVVCAAFREFRNRATFLTGVLGGCGYLIHKGISGKI